MLRGENIGKKTKLSTYSNISGTYIATLNDRRDCNSVVNIRQNLMKFNFFDKFWCLFLLVQSELSYLMWLKS